MKFHESLDYIYTIPCSLFHKFKNLYRLSQSIDLSGPHFVENSFQFAAPLCVIFDWYFIPCCPKIGVGSSNKAASNQENKYNSQDNLVHRLLSQPVTIVNTAFAFPFCNKFVIFCFYGENHNVAFNLHCGPMS